LRFQAERRTYRESIITGAEQCWVENDKSYKNGMALWVFIITTLNMPEFTPSEFARLNRETYEDSKSRATHHYPKYEMAKPR
jgi:hypothetical protein